MIFSTKISPAPPTHKTSTARKHIEHQQKIITSNTPTNPPQNPPCTIFSPKASTSSLCFSSLCKALVTQPTLRETRQQQDPTLPARRNGRGIFFPSPACVFRHPGDRRRMGGAPVGGTGRTPWTIDDHAPPPGDPRADARPRVVASDQPGAASDDRSASD